MILHRWFPFIPMHKSTTLTQNLLSFKLSALDQLTEMALGSDLLSAWSDPATSAKS